jgi:hypothetical protein
MREVEDQVVLTDELYAEWQLHWSRFFRIWLRSMWARKQVIRIDADRDTTMRARLRELGLGERQLREAEKGCAPT